MKLLLFLTLVLLLNFSIFTKHLKHKSQKTVVRRLFEKRLFKNNCKKHSNEKKCKCKYNSKAGVRKLFEGKPVRCSELNIFVDCETSLHCVWLEKSNRCAYREPFKKDY